MEKTGFPIWPQIDNVPRQYPWLADDISCDVCVIGGGVTGAMCAMRLAERGVATVLLTAKQIGFGATASTMPSAEYDCGQTIRSLAKYSDRETAVRLMTLAQEAIDSLEQLSINSADDFGFKRRDCMLFTDDNSQLELLSREYIERRKAGFDCTYISRSAASDVFAFDIAGAIVTKGGAGELDPYRLAHLCIDRAVSAGARVYENTKAARIDCDDEGDCTITTSTYRRVRAEKVVIAAGGACADILDGLASPRTFFMIASSPMAHIPDWPGRCVLRSFGTPDVTYASAPDGRIFSCGLATSVVDEYSRLGGIVRIPSLHRKRFEEMEMGAHYIFPNAGDIYFKYAYAARCCQTHDGLPVIGVSDEQPGCIFAVCCGSGGVLLSEVASRMVIDSVEGRDSHDTRIFSPERRSLCAMGR
ncbi:MAG: FAD-binding oxidoreductase [Clostridia bacterium]|nr:FAD-binding oxidoreductase [Clostridia bacterium]